VVAVSELRKRFVVSARHDDKWWMVESESLGLLTQARTVQEIEPMARSIISLHLEVPPESFDIEIRFEFQTPELSDDLDDLISNREYLEDRAAEERYRVWTLARALVESEGLTMRDTGAMLGLSHQRIAQLIHTERPPGTAENEAQGEAGVIDVAEIRRS
jgi:hypothetical protein